MRIIESLPLTQTGLLPDLIQAYLSGDEAVRGLYEYSPAIESFAEAIRNRKNFRIDRELLADTLMNQYQSVTDQETVVKNIGLLRHEHTFTVTAAHQPCLLMGPLYNILKIAGVIHTCQLLTQKYPGYQFVPVFWMGSEDHDIEELRYTTIGQQAITWPQEVKGAIGRVPVNVMSEPIKKAQELLGSSPLINALQRGTEVAKDFASYTRYLLHTLFGKYGLVVLNADDASFKRALLPVMKEELAKQCAASCLQETVDFLETNFKAQVKPRPINFFYLKDDLRERITINEAGNYTVVNTDITFTPQQLSDELDSHPERFSPNVVYRPLYQEILLPNLAFVGGSGELSYWLEYKNLFHYFNVHYPVLLMRSMGALINSATYRKLTKSGASLAMLLKPEHEAVQEYIRHKVANEVSLHDEMKQLSALMEQVAQKASGVDSTLSTSADAEKQKMLQGLQNLEGKMLKAEKRKEETGINQLKSVRDVLFPEGQLQERKMNFLNYHSDTFIDCMVKDANPFKLEFILWETINLSPAQVQETA